jgi:hypothetical protein
MSHQQDLFTDLPRGEQLAALRKLKLDSYQCSSGKVSGAVQKAILKVIDDHDSGRGCFASQDTIADETGYGVSTVRRAITALVAQDLITKERPNHWSPNHHRVNWTEVTRLASDSCEPSTAHSGSTESSHVPVREFTGAGPSVHSERRNAHRNENLNAPPIAQAETPQWEAVAKELFNWGLKSASVAVASARLRGLSIDHVRELWHECGGSREPNRWEPGQLANWLTGANPLPFDADEATQRQQKRRRNTQAASDAEDAAKAEQIRRQARFDARGRDVTEEAIQTVTIKRLQRAGLERFC